MERTVALKLLDETKQNYNLVAEEFAQTRRFISAGLKSLADYLQPGDKILDLGCGSGRLIEIIGNKKVDYIGIDNSEKLIEIACQQYPNYHFQLFDGSRIPFPDDYFNKVFCIAVLHHIPDNQLRIEFLKEAKRVLKPGGTMILSVWYLWQEKTYWYLLAKFTLKKLLGRSKLDFFDIIEFWFGKAYRYMHLFRKNELKNLIQKADFIVTGINILRTGQRGKNLLVTAKK